MRIVQEAVSDGDVDKAVVYLNKIKFPRLLIKSVRSGYYMLQSNLSMASDDLNTAEANIRKSLNTKSALDADLKGTSVMQLGFIQLKQGKGKDAKQSFLEAIKLGIQDKENLAAVYLQLCNMELQRGANRMGKEYFKKAKALKPKTEEIAKQIQMMDKNISRLPG